MPETDYAQIPYPDGDQDAIVAADLMALAEKVDETIDLIAIDAADRDARFSGLAAGRTVRTPAGTEWVKTSNPPAAPTWKTVITDTDVVTSGIAQANPVVPWKLDSQWGRRRNGMTTVVLVMIYEGEDITAPSTGNISNTTVATILGSWVTPVRIGLNFYGPGTFGEASTNTDGTVTLIGISSSSQIKQGESCRFTMIYPSKD